MKVPVGVFGMIGVGVICAIAVAATAPATAAELELHGFVEAAGGVRLPDPGPPPAAWGTVPPGTVWSDAADFTLREARLQLKSDVYSKGAESHFVADLLADQVADDPAAVVIREAWIKFNAFGDHLEVRAGRQPTTWGTGDLLFINDLFPKDYVSFFIGREDQYLKVPSDALRLGWFGLPMAVDLVYTPIFAPNTLASGERLVFWAPALAPVTDPQQTLENGETALRLSRTLGSYNLSLYGYWGLWKNPIGFVPPGPDGGSGSYVYPALDVYGASVRGGLLGGVAWLEGGWYDSTDDRDGADPLTPNSEARAMGGYERQWWSDFTGGAQVYWEGVQDYRPGEYLKDEHYTLITLRLLQMLRYQTVELSAFTFYSPSDEDVYARLSLGYDYTDEVTLTLGANVFGGNDRRTLFGMNEDNTNAYFRIRYGF